MAMNLSFESTIGEVLDCPEAKALFEEMVPEAKDYSQMLEMGRALTLNQAMPFIESIAAGLGIDNVEERVVEFKAALEAL